MEKKMENPERESVESGIGDVPSLDLGSPFERLATAAWATEIARKQTRKVARLSGGILFLLSSACSPVKPTIPTETPIVTETTGIPTPTLEITPTPTEAPTLTPTKEPIPTATKEPTPEPIPTVTVEAVGFGMEDLTPEEQKLATELETSYRTATENQGLKEGIIYLTHGDQVGEIGGYFKDKKGFWYLVEREEKILEEVPKLQGTTIIWSPNEVRFEYKHQDLSYNWIWQPPGRLIYDPVVNDYVAQWNPETSSWTMNPEPIPTSEPENWVYIKGVENVRFAEFNQEQIQMLKEAAALVKQYDSERFALFEKEIDWVILWGSSGHSRYENKKIYVADSGFPTQGAISRQIIIFAIAENIWGHEFQHHLQKIEGGLTTCEEREADACGAEIELIQKMRYSVSNENQWWIDRKLEELQEMINGTKPFPTCLFGWENA